MRFFYNLIYGILLFTGLPFFIFFTRKKGYSPDLKERFVLYSDKKEDYLWFHCASVGELNLARPLIEYFKNRKKILITVSSPRGKEHAVKNYPYAAVRVLPFDLSFLIRKFIAMYRPSALIVVEGELWFNLITVSSGHIPVFSVNARLSPSSFNLYKKLGFFYRKIFNSFSLILARSETDYRYIKQFLGDESRIKLCGDLKYVSSKSKKKVEFYAEGKVIIAGSTHPPEEEILLKVFKKLKEKYPDLKLVIAPRHVERTDEVVQIVRRYGFTPTLRTESVRAETDVYVVNTVGELGGLYRYADGVFIGGTIANVGGHNVLEAAVEGKEVVIGKNHHKIRDMVQELESEGVLHIAEDEKQLERIFEEILEREKPAVDFEKKAEKIFNCYVNSLEKLLKLEKKSDG
ncbi:3-deoxy-D-manno-octulosonic acid transferase [Persephonella sp.]